MTARPLRVFLGLVCACFCAQSASAFAAGGTLDRIRDTGTITFAYRAGAAPFSFADRDGRVRGYSTELCAEVAASIQQQLKLPTLKVAWIPVDATDRLEAVAGGRADAECGTTTMTLSRMQKVDFSLPIFVDGATLLTRANSKIGKLADLKSRKVAVIAGTTTEQALVAAMNLQNAAATLVPVKDGAEGVLLLSSGKVDAYAGDRVVLAGFKLRQVGGKNLELFGSDFSYEPYGIVVRRDDADFRLAVNRAIAELYKRGGIDQLYQRWLAPLGPPGPLLNAMYYLNAIPE
ncbi:MAG TPA: amino acid ABC transporter substrate-binding protein [Casimicrobiaceae bacterium]